MSKTYKLTTTVPGNVSINLPDGQILKVGKVVEVDERVVQNSGVARYIEIGRIVVLAEGSVVPTIKASDETKVVVGTAGDTSVEKVLSPAPAKKSKAKPVVAEEAVTIPVPTPTEIKVEPDPLETSKDGAAATVIEPKVE